MITPELNAYIRQQLGIGTAKDVIKKTLSEKGWSEQDLNDAFAAIETQPQSPSPQKIIPPSQPINQPVSSGGHKGVLAIIVVIVLLLCAGGAFAAYYFGLFATPAPATTNLLMPTMPAVTTASSTPSNITSIPATTISTLLNSGSTTMEIVATSSLADVSNWKTYTNQQYSFSFKYPIDWGTPINADFIKTEGSGEVGFASPNPDAEAPDIRLNINITLANNETIDQLVSDEGNFPQFTSMSEIQKTMLGGVDARSFLEHREGGFANYGLFALHGGYDYKIYYGNWLWGDSAPTSTLQSKTVLSTFQFIQP
jgi:hypothetical protein